MHVLINIFFKLALIGIKASLFLGVISILWVGIHRFIPVTQTSLMGWRVITTDVTPSTLQHQYVTIDQISPHLQRAVIASEDTKFCKHIGVDFGAMRQVVKDFRKTGRVRGGSTITQQTAKNAFLYPNQDPVRKLAEFWFTGWIELFWPKERILETYLNIAEWGDGIFGAEAAAQHYFNKPASALTQSEAIKLVAVLPNPRYFKVHGQQQFVINAQTRLPARLVFIEKYNRTHCLTIDQEQ